MAFLNRILAQIKAQMGGLGLSQKMVIALLLVIMAGAVWVMVNFSAQRERVPLLGQSFTQEEIMRISTILDQDTEDYLVSGDRILVYRNRRSAIMAKLSLAEALPQDTSTGWEAILQDSDMMLPDSARKDRNTVVLQINLATIIARWSYVKSVHVIIDKGRRQRIVGSATPPATASVAIESNGRYSAKKLAHAAAAFISGSVDRLKPENVSVVIDGNHIPIMSNDDMGDQEYLAVKKEYEDHQRKKIADLMPPGSMVQVNVKWNNADQTVNTREYNEKTSWLAVTETMALEDTSNVSERQEEPGLIANVSSPAGGSGNRQEQSTDESKATKKPYAGVVETIERRRQGGIKDVTATVRVPEEYYSEMARNGGEQEPDQAIVNALIAQELSDLKEVVMATVGFPKGEGEDRVFVDTYWAGGKVAATDATDSTQNTGAVGTITNMASRYGKHIAVSALAMISLFMALMMVRKTVGPVDLSEEEAAAMLNNPPLDAQGFGDSQIDDGSGNDALLSGLELDDKSIRSQQMLEQIREMVTDSPEITSELVSKWISQDI